MEHGIDGTFQDIGLAECANQTIVAMTKRMLEVQKLEKWLWTKTMSNAVYTID